MGIDMGGIKHIEKERKNNNRGNKGLIFWIIPGVALLIGLSFLTKDYEEIDQADLIRRTYGVFALEIPESLKFAGENVPLENFDTRESLDRELLVNTYFHSQTLLYIKKAPRYFPVIEPILKEHNIPEDFKYLPLAESGLSNAISPASAVGFWQLMEGTARENGLEVNAEVDERYDLEKSTVVACKYLLKSYEKYQNWTMVAASYNNGRRGVERQIEKQNEMDYYDLLLNEETARYIFRILAIKLILEEPEKYGFYFEDHDLYQPIHSYKVTVDSSITSFAEFAKGFNTNYKMLKLLNPWLRETYLSNKKGKTYQINIPEEGVRTRNIEESLNTEE
jgi:membrane-bound lytic murein transglycosylase D